MKMVYVLAGAVVIAGGAAIFGSGKGLMPAAESPPQAGASQPGGNEVDPSGAPDDPASASAEVLEGTVLEKLDVPSYTYLRIGAPGSDGQWAAVSTANVEVGKSVRVRGQTVMTNFESPTLKRTFESIRFGVLEGPGPVDPNAALPTGHPNVGSGSGAAPESSDEVKVGKIEKAPGPNGKRIAELFAQKKQLAGKSVRVRGVVVKVTSGVMGKNFAHIKDGSGSAANKDDDITVTSTEPMQRGQTVVAEGTLTLDEDLGAGYKYDAILEDAKLVQ
jgi:hypothetical protein